MAITDQSTFAAALANSERLPITKASVANTAAGQWTSLWRAAGIPVAPAIPGAWAACTGATSGGLPYTAAGGGATKYLTGITAALATAGALAVVLRAGHSGNLNGTLATAQTVNASIPAGLGFAVTGADAEWWLEWYTDTGGTAVTATITYTNQSDVSGRTCTVALAATRRAGTMLRIVPSTAGDFIKSIQSVTLSATTGTAGAFGVTLTRQLALAPAAVTPFGVLLDAVNLGVPVVPTGACLALAVLPSTTSTGLVLGEVRAGSA